MGRGGGVGRRLYKLNEGGDNDRVQDGKRCFCVCVWGGGENGGRGEKTDCVRQAHNISALDTDRINLLEKEAMKNQEIRTDRKRCKYPKDLIKTRLTC